MKLKRFIAIILVFILVIPAANFALASNESDWWNILLLGCDSYKDGQYTRTDSMIILSLNTVTHEIKMTSLMRDTWIQDPVTGKERKLTELCAVGRGPSRTITAINNNFGMNIESYVLISMEAIATVIDLLGGVDLDVTEKERRALNKGLFDLSEYSGMEKLQESGENVHLNGNQATAFARIRKIDSDFVRTERQRTVLIKLAEIMVNNLTPENLIPVINSLMKYVDTNLTLTDIMAIGSFAMTCDIHNIKQFRVPADGTYQSGTFNGVWCIKPNYKKNRALLHQFIYSDD